MNSSNQRFMNSWGGNPPGWGTFTAAYATQGVTSDVERRSPALTRWAARVSYNPTQLASVMWESPWAIIPEVFSGMRVSGPGYQALRDLGADPLSVYRLMVGHSSDLAEAGTDGYANWLSSLYGSLGLRGGRQFSASELLSNLFNSANGSALHTILSSGDASTQMRTLFNLARDASNVGMNPLAAHDYQAAMVQDADEAMHQLLRYNSDRGTSPQSSYRLVASFAPHLVPR